MKRTFLASCLIGFGLIGSAQEYDRNAWKFAESITSKELKEHLKIISSDEYEGRETGKKGQKMAMSYLINEFEKQGIAGVEKHGFIQSYPLVEQEMNGINLKIGGVEYKLNKDYRVLPSVMENITISGDIVFVGYGIEDKKINNYKNKDVLGKAVFICNGQPKKGKFEKPWNIKRKIDLAKEKGASAVFIYNPKLSKNLIKYEHHYKKSKITLKENLKVQTPIIHLTETASNAILKEGKSSIKRIEKKGMKKVESIKIGFELEINKPTNMLSGENVLAYIPGTDKKEELIVITAHYDHIGKEGDLVFNGADDDGTGTVSLLEISDAFQNAAKVGFRPKRSILIMPVSGEEKGLLGSKYYTNNPIFPLENTVANLNIDMIGRYDKNHKNDSNYIYLIGADKLSKDLHNLSEKVNSTYTKIGLDYTYNDENDPNRFYYRSDHYNFAKNNVPVIFYFSGVHEDYHKATDTAEKIDYEKTERVARLVFLTAWHLANRENRLELD